MLFEIKHRYNGSILFSLECGSLKLCIEAAVKSKANLSYADLRYANLRYANLRYANLRYANLSYANLRYANLRYANLRYANLRYANLRYANLRYANLSYANLRYANLSYANLRYANLSYANLLKVSALTLAKLRITPTEGAFVGWKKLEGGLIAKLVIPHDAERLNAYSSRKCRASKVFVHEIFGASEGVDKHTGKTIYKTGCEVFPDSFDPDPRIECSNGIHFFLTKEEAEDY